VYSRRCVWWGFCVTQERGASEMSTRGMCGGRVPESTQGPTPVRLGPLILQVWSRAP
jgi:hypothetical protein